MTKRTSKSKEQPKKEIFFEVRTWLIITFVLVFVSIILGNYIFYIIPTFSFIFTIINYLRNKRFPSDVETREESRKSERRIKDKVSRDTEKIIRKIDENKQTEPTLLNEKVGKIRGDMDRALQASDWEVNTLAEKDILIDIGTLESVPRHLEFIAEKNQTLTNTKTKILRYYIVTRFLSALDITDRQITIMTQPKGEINRIFCRFLPFQVESPDDLLKLLHESNDAVSTGRSNYGPLTEYFDSKINECIEDTKFLFNNLQNEFNAGQYIEKVTGPAGKEVISFTRILPILVICTDIQEETEDGAFNDITNILYERDGIFIDVISESCIQNLVDIVNKEFNDLLDWLDAY